MAEEQTRTDEAQASAGANASGSAAASGGLNAEGSQKTTQSTKRTPPKLGKKQPSQQQTPQSTPKKEQQQVTNGADGEDARAEEKENVPPPAPQSRAQSKRRQSRGRGRSRAQDSDTESIARSDVSQPAQGRRNRNRRKGKPTMEKEAPPQSNGGQGGGPLDSLDEVGETVNGAGEMVGQTVGGATDQAGQAVGGATDKVGKTLGGLTGGGKKGGKEGEGEEDEGKGEQLRLRIELNLDIEIQLKAKIHGDLTIGLLHAVMGHISNLPDEILVAIFKINAPCQSLDVFSRYTEFLPLLRVCKRWQLLSDPLLVRKLEVGQGGWLSPQNERTTELLVKFFRNPSLCRHVRTLAIRMPMMHHLETLKYCTPIADLISLCALVREIYLGFEWTTIPIPIAHAIAGLSDLKILRLTGSNEDGVLMRPVIRYFGHPSIQSVRVEGLSERETTTASCLEVVKAAGTSKATKLCISDPNVEPMTTKRLVEWPQRLEELTITVAHHRPYANHYNTQWLQEILDVHRESLRYISIGPIYGSRRMIPDFSAYPSLRKLQVPACGLFAETPATISENVSASCLEEMIIDFETDDSHTNDDGTEISKAQVDWFSGFGNSFNVIEMRTNY
ncbi:hypothetical protein G7Y79_00053g087940 [Physcia stellaris]|nr:hypothetical protein G7Y79_00053g087940 [Physcia stellaris]